MTRCHIVVTGRVQGVGFRFFCRDLAMDMNVTGWVRNRSDGTVEMEVQGVSNVLAQLCAAVERGPAMSRVTGVASTSIPTLSDEDSFDIRF